MQRQLTLWLAVAVLVVVGLLPLAAMLAKSLFLDGELTLAAYAKIFANPGQQLEALGNSLALAGLTAASATLLGTLLGLALAKTDLPLRRTLTVLLSIPLLLPPYILAVCWLNLLARDGMLVRMLPAQGVQTVARWLFGLPGCVWVLTSALLPAVMILTIVYIRAVNPRLEEAGRMIAGWPGTLHRVTLPTILPGILSAAIIVFLLALGEVGVPMLLRYPVLPLETLTQFSAFYDFGAAAAAATPMLAITLLVLGLEHRLLRDKVCRLRAAPGGQRMLLITLGRWRIPVFLAIVTLAAVFVVLPLVALVSSSLTPFAYGDAWSKAADSLGRTVGFAAIGATLLTALGFLCGYLVHQRALRLWRAVDALTLLLFTLPGTVIGVGLIALWNRPATGRLYASAAMIVFAYLAQYTALTSRIALAALTHVPQSREEAAQIAGAPWLATIWEIVVPAARPGIIGAWLIGFIFCVRDLGASMLVYPAGQDTLPVRIFTLMANGAPSLISALCVILATVTLAALAVLGILLRAQIARP